MNRFTTVCASSLLCTSMMFICVDARAEVLCEISEIQVDAYDHGGTYLHGKINGGGVVYFMSICGTTAGAQDCTSRAADRRLAIALAAQAEGKNLLAYFANFNSCAQVTPYSLISGLRTLY